MLLVIPTVIECCDGRIFIDGDFSNNLESYLQNFEHVSLLCPAIMHAGAFPNVRDVDAIAGHERLSITVLPEPYREDRYVFRKRAVSATLRRELAAADYILISPHAPFDWSTLAAELCIAMGIPYNMEADWDLPQVSRYIWSQMPFGLRKLRKLLWQKYYDPKYLRCLRNSTLSLTQGRDIYNAYKGLAPNCHEVLNVQVTETDHITADQLTAKINTARTREKLQIFYGGRAIDIKGPFHWIDTIDALHQSGIPVEATWVGEGPCLDRMRQIVAERKLEGICHLPGKVSRDEVKARLLDADLLLFCHMTKESPRCLVEALAAGTPIVGFGTAYAESLVEAKGGGRFVSCGDTRELIATACQIAEDRASLAELIAQAAASGALLDRDRAILHRIALMKTHLGSQRQGSPLPVLPKPLVSALG